MKIIYFFLLPFCVYSHKLNIKPVFNNTIHWTRNKSVKLRTFLQANLDVLYL